MERHAEVLAATVAGVRGAEDAEHVDVVGPRPRRADRPPVRPGPHGRGRRRPPGRAAPGAARHAEPRHAVRRGPRHRRLVRPAPRRDGRLQRPRQRPQGRAVLGLRRRRRRRTRACRARERGDTAVPLSSARWTITDAETGDVAHATMPASGALFTDFVKPRLVGRARRGRAGRAARAAADEPPAATPRSHQLLAQRIVTVAPGGDGVLAPLDVDGGSQLGVTVLAPPEVKAVLAKPDGTVADTADAGTHARAGRGRPRARALARAPALDRGRAGAGRPGGRRARRPVERRPAARPPGGRRRRAAARGHHAASTGASPTRAVTVEVQRRGGGSGAGHAARRRRSTATACPATAATAPSRGSTPARRSCACACGAATPSACGSAWADIPEAGRRGPPPDVPGPARAQRRDRVQLRDLDRRPEGHRGPPSIPRARSARCRSAPAGPSEARWSADGTAAGVGRGRRGVRRERPTAPSRCKVAGGDDVRARRRRLVARRHAARVRAQLRRGRPRRSTSSAR